MSRLDIGRVYQIQLYVKMAVSCNAIIRPALEWLPMQVFFIPAFREVALDAQNPPGVGGSWAARRLDQAVANLILALPRVYVNGRTAMYSQERTDGLTRLALLQHRPDRTFQTDCPQVFIRLLRAQGWTHLGGNFVKRSTHMLAEHMDYGEIKVFESGLVLAAGARVLMFLDSLVEWSGGAL